MTYYDVIDDRPLKEKVASACLHVALNTTRAVLRVVLRVHKKTLDRLSRYL